MTVVLLLEKVKAQLAIWLAESEQKGMDAEAIVKATPHPEHWEALEALNTFPPKKELEDQAAPPVS
jgi:hypothetical protein